MDLNIEKNNSDGSSMNVAEPNDKIKNSFFGNNAFSNRRKKGLLIGCLCTGLIIVIIIVVLIVVLNNGHKTENDSLDKDENETPEYSIAPNPETGEPPLFGSDPNKDNSGEAFVEFEKSIIASPNYSIVVKNNARISIAAYYNAINKYDEAIQTLDDINIEDVFDVQLKQLYDTYADAYSGLGEVERADEYRARAEQIES